MSRSVWKGPYINNNFKAKKIYTEKSSTIIARNTEIIPKFVGLTFKVHNGKNFLNVVVNDKMIGHKFGEFCFTRARFVFKNKKLIHGAKN
jgi:small subunit ribosomal protein S19